jgi:hypothetical protein
VLPWCTYEQAQVFQIALEALASLACCFVRMTNFVVKPLSSSGTKRQSGITGAVPRVVLLHIYSCLSGKRPPTKHCVGV